MFYFGEFENKARVEHYLFTTEITFDEFKQMVANESKFLQGLENYTQNIFDKTLNSLANLLKYKNEKYGNSALEPLQIFGNKCKVGTRLDDKLARVKNSNELKKNDIADLIGYLTLICVENNWSNFDEFKD
jgi:hypothetical protein